MKEEEINLNEVFRKIKKIPKFLLSKWKAIVLFGILGGATGLTVSLLVKKTYISKLSFVIEEENSSSSSGLMSIASSFGFGGASASGLFSTPNIINFLQTKSLVEKALLYPVHNTKRSFADIYIKTYELDKNWQEYSKLKKIKFLPNDNPNKFTPEKDSILRDLFLKIIDKGELSVVQPFEESNIIDIEVKTKNELFSRYFPETLINVVADYYTKTKTKKSLANVAVLQKQVDSVRNELYNSMVGAATSNDNVFGLNPAMNVMRVPSAKNQIQVQANSAILTELIKNLEISKMNLMSETPLIEVIDKPKLPLLFSKIPTILGTLVGGFVFGFLTIVVLLMKKAFGKVK